MQVPETQLPEHAAADLTEAGLNWPLMRFLAGLMNKADAFEGFMFFLHLNLASTCDITFRKVHALRDFNVRNAKFKRVFSMRVFLLLMMALIVATSSAQVLQLPVIVLKADPKKAKQSNTDFPVSYSGKSIQNAPASNVTQYLQQQGLLSVKGNSSNSSQTDISLHGFGANASQNSLVLIDGIADTSETNVGPNLNSLIPFNIGKIDVLPGSYGAEFGNQAVGGVVNFHTHRPGKAVYKAKISAGNNGQLASQVLMSERLKNHIGYTFAASVGENKHTQPHQKFREGVVNTKVDYIGQSGSVSLNFIDYRNHAQVPAAYQWGGGQLAYSNKNDTQTNSGLTYLKSDQFFAHNWQWQSALVSHATDLDGVMGRAFFSNQNHWEVSNKLRYKKVFTIGHQMDYDTYGLSNGALNEHANDLKQALFLNDSMPISSSLSLLTGVRGALQQVRTRPGESRYQHDSRVAATSVGLRYQLNEQTHLFLRRADNFRFADAKEQMWTPSSILTLKTQRGASYELGVNWQNHLKVLKLSLYDLRLRNELALNPKPSNGSPFPLMSNLPPTERIGIDAFFQYPLSGHLLFNAQSALVRSHFRSGQYQGKQIPSVSAVHASTAFQYAFNGWSFSANENVSGSYYAADDLSNQGPKMPPIWLTNLSVQKQIKQLTVALVVNNLFDRRYPRYAYYLPADSFGPSEVNYYLADGVSALLSLSVSF